MADTNWFYSTLAQSTAAIVGLAGGFLTTRLIDRRREVANDLPRLRRRVKSVGQSLRSARDDGRRTVDELRRLIDDLQSQIEDGAEVMSIPLTRLLIAHSAGTATPKDMDRLRDALKAVDDWRDAHDWSDQDLVTLMAKGRPLNPRGHQWLSQEASREPAPPANGEDGVPGFWEQLDYQRRWAAHRWTHVAVVQYDSVTSEVRGFRDSLVPPSVYWILAVLGAMLVICVIFPMGFLTARDDWTWPVMLCAFGVLSLAFLGILGLEVRRLRSAQDLREDWG